MMHCAGYYYIDGSWDLAPGLGWRAEAGPCIVMHVFLLTILITKP